MDVSLDKTGTLRAQANHPPCVLENHPADSRIKISEDAVVQTLTSRCGTGGGNVPLLMDTPKTLKIRCGHGDGGRGALIQENLSATLATNNDQTLFVPKAYGVCAKHSNSMLSDNPKSGFYEATTSRTLDENCNNPNCNQGGVAVVSVQGSMIGRTDKNGPQGDGINEDISFTLNTVDRHAVAYGIDRATYNMGCGCPVDTSCEARSTDRGDSRDQNAQFNISVQEEVEPTLVAKGAGAVAQPSYKDPPTVNDTDSEFRYIVRRLTPTECARLQGFPDWWTENLETESPTDEEIKFWADVFETHRNLVTHASKPKTEKQIRKWLANPYSDSAAYRMWGNGICLENARFVLSGIAYFANCDKCKK